MEERDTLTEKIISCCFKAHSELGPGFNEKIYHNTLMILLKETGLEYETEKEFNVLFEAKKVGVFRLDLVIQQKIIVEIKALTGNIPEVFKYQLLSYLKASGLRIGLLVNFGNKSCQVKRFVI